MVQYGGPTRERMQCGGTAGKRKSRRRHALFSEGWLHPGEVDDIRRCRSRALRGARAGLVAEAAAQRLGRTLGGETALAAPPPKEVPEATSNITTVQNKCKSS